MYLLHQKINMVAQEKAVTKTTHCTRLKQHNSSYTVNAIDIRRIVRNYSVRKFFIFSLSLYYLSQK